MRAMHADPPESSPIHAEQAGGVLTLRRRTGSRHVGVMPLGLLIPWAAFGPAYLASGAEGWPPAEVVFFCILMFAAWPFVLIWAVNHLSGYEALRIGPGGVERCQGSWIWKSRRHAPLVEIRGLAHARPGKPVNNLQPPRSSP